MAETWLLISRDADAKRFTVDLLEFTSSMNRKRPFPRPPESVTAWKNLRSFVLGSMKTFDPTAYHESVPSVLPPPAMKPFSTPTAMADELSSIRFTWNENDVRLPNPECKV